MTDISEHDAAGAAREQAAKTGVYVIMMMAAIPALVWVERISRNPDAWRLAKMRAALAAETFCMRSARNWARWADQARGVYEAARA